MPKSCKDTYCPERIDCCTTVRWRISKSEYNDPVLRDWWLAHEGSRMYKEGDVYYIHWPMKCKYVSENGMECTDYNNRPLNCKLYVCDRMKA